MSAVQTFAEISWEPVDDGPAPAPAPAPSPAAVDGFCQTLARQPLAPTEVRTLMALARQPGTADARLAQVSEDSFAPRIRSLCGSRHAALAERLEGDDGTCWTLRPEAYAALIRLGYLRWADPFANGPV